METQVPTMDYRIINREYDIPTFRLPILKEMLNKLNKKADKLGCDRADMTVISEPFIQQVTLNDHKYDIEYVTVSVNGEAPKLAGWAFVGYISDDGLVYGDHIERSERERQGECDYCKITRYRKHTYVVAHENGERQVVGSGCLKDFLGGKSPDGIATLLSYFRELSDRLSDTDVSLESREDWYSPDLTTVLTTAWQVIRTYGWVSGGKAWQDSSLRATKDVVNNLIYKPTSQESIDFGKAWSETKERNNYPDSDPQLIEDAIAWAQSFEDNDKDYLNNIAIIANRNYANQKSMGMAVSILSSYEREVAKRIRDEARNALAEASDHVGEVGKRQIFEDVTLTDLKYLDSDFGTTVLHKFVVDGNQLVWFGSRELDGTPNVGDTFSIKGTVKKHDEFNNIPQTIISRVAKI